MESKSEGKGVVEKTDSCKIAVNAKGLWSGEVKVYAEDVNDAMRIALGKAEELSKRIKMENGG